MSREGRRLARGAARWEPAHELVSASVNLKPCPACGKNQGELRKSEFGSRFPHYVKCGACGFMTEFVTLPGVAAKLWNEAKKPEKAKKL
jgi:ssDNA-binding Zn-finger/Zn-ribbon topoisomerase 1